jgi:hypothetical protein
MTGTIEIIGLLCVKKEKGKRKGWIEGYKERKRNK